MLNAVQYKLLAISRQEMQNGRLVFFQTHGNSMSKTKIEMIYADDDIIVINKPTGVSVTKDRSGAAELLDILNDQLGQQVSSQLRLVHRLDKHTSGVMILAR